MPVRQAAGIFECANFSDAKLEEVRADRFVALMLQMLVDDGGQ